MNIWIEYTYNFLRVSLTKFSNKGAVWALLLDPELKRHALFIISSQGINVYIEGVSPYLDTIIKMWKQKCIVQSF